jgi:hypothetical protein
MRPGSDAELYCRPYLGLARLPGGDADRRDRAAVVVSDVQGARGRVLDSDAAYMLLAAGITSHEGQRDGAHELSSGYV